MKAELIKRLLGAEARKNAGKFAADAGRFLVPEGMGTGELALRVMPDAAFGLLAAGMAPEEATLAERALMFGGSTLGGTLGGLTAGGALNKLGIKNQTAGTMADLAGSVVGDMAGHHLAMGGSAALNALSGGPGQDVYTRMSNREREAYANQIREQTLAAAGMIPGHRYDEFMASQGLA